MELSALKFAGDASLTMPEDRAFEFENVALPHAGGLLRYALHLAGEKPRAEDLVQDTLLSAWRNLADAGYGLEVSAF
jgi:DNA-directed RNA polymerase specialized sigma24 family protein